MPPIAVILPAAGRSTRFGGQASKIFALLDDIPVLVWAIRAFAAREDVAQIIIAASDIAGTERCCECLSPEQRRKLTICKGGSSRAASVRAGVEKSTADIEWVAVHDAARPLVSQELIDRVFAAAKEHGCAVPALPVSLTIKQATGPLPAIVQRTVPRQQLWAMQTPQVMRRQDLLDAYQSCSIALDDVTDDAQFIELAGKPVWLVTGAERNIKITTQLDMKLAEILCKG